MIIMSKIEAASLFEIFLISDTVTSLLLSHYAHALCYLLRFFIVYHDCRGSSGSLNACRLGFSFHRFRIYSFVSFIISPVAASELLDISIIE